MKLYCLCRLQSLEISDRDNGRTGDVESNVTIIEVQREIHSKGPLHKSCPTHYKGGWGSRTVLGEDGLHLESEPEGGKMVSLIAREEATALGFLHLRSLKDTKQTQYLSRFEEFSSISGPPREKNSDPRLCQLHVVREGKGRCVVCG